MNATIAPPQDAQITAEILTIPEVVRYLRISRTHGYDLVRKGIIPSFTLGKSVRVRRKDLLKFVETQLR